MATAQYVVDIAAQMPSGEPTIAQLDKLSEGLMAGGKGADFFGQAISQVSDQLTGAKAASAAANAALAEGNAKFNELEKAANKAALAEEKAALSGKLDPSIARSAFQAKAALEAYGFTLKSLEQNAAAATSKEDALAKSLDNVKKLGGHVDKSLGAQAESTEKLRGALSSVPGPIGKIGSSLLGPVQGFQKLSASMGASNAAMVIGATAAAALVVAVLAVAAAAVYATASIAAWAVGLADSNRNAALSTQAMEAMHPELLALRGTIASVADETGMHADELQELAGRLKEAKVAVGDMPAALRAAALAETALGKGGAQDFIADLKAGKVAASVLSAEVQSKLGGIVAKQMMGLDAQSARLKKNIGALFGGLNIEPVLGAMQTLVELFDKNTAAGQAMQLIFESVFQPIIDKAQTAAYFVEAFALGFLIGLTKVYIAVKPAIKAISEFFGFKDSSLADGLNVAKIAGEVLVPVVLGIAAVFTVVVGVIGLAIAQMLLVPAAIFAIIGAIGVFVGWLLGKFQAAWQSVADFLANFSLVDVGMNIITGLANGLVHAGPAVLKAITGVVTDAIGAAKHLLGIASPSKVFAEIGGYTGEGMAIGLEDSTDGVQDAFTEMMTPPEVPVSSLAAQDIGGSGTLFGGAASAPSAQATDQAQGAKASKPAVDLSGATFQFYGVKDAEHGASMLEEALTRLLEGDAAAAGAEATA